MHPLTLARRAVRDFHAIQKEGELAAFAALVMDLEPRVIVEIGADAGGTLWLWSQLSPRVIAVDLPKTRVGVFSSGLDLDSHGCEVIYGDSHDLHTRYLLKKALDGQPVDVLFVDGDHKYEGVKADFEMYSPLVRPGGIVAFHDILRYRPEIEVPRFWQTLDGDKEEIVTSPATLMGIGVLRMPATERVGV